MQQFGTLHRFLLVYFVLHIAGVLLFLLVVSPWLNSQLLEQTQRRLEAVAITLQQFLATTDPAMSSTQTHSQLTASAQQMQLRITLVDAVGKVLYDSEGNTQEMPNHANRPEIVRAGVSGQGIDIRTSQTSGRPMMYLAVAVDDAQTKARTGFVRVAVDQKFTSDITGRMQQFIWLFALGLAALAGAAMWTFGFQNFQPLSEFSAAARRIAAGQYESVPLALTRRDEWRNLSEAFRYMQQEITTREARLLENSQRLEAVLSSMIEGVIAIDSTGTVMLANEAACEILDLEQQNFVGRKLLELVRIPPLRQSIEKTQLQRTFSKVEFQTIGETRKTVSARVSSLARDPLPGVAIVLHDVTELRQLESMRRDFVANVSHELKTPLASIKAYAETLRMGAINDADNNLKFLQMIETQADLLNEQVQDLLRLARVESGQAVFEIVNVNVELLCQQAVELHLAEAKSRQVKLSLAAIPRELFARADRDGMVTMLSNLITNAIRYTPAGGEVTIRAFAQDNSAVMEVRDTGIGIAAEHQSRVFERFYRVDRARSREAGGTGLGLSIVKHLAQALGGGVHLESQLGKGSVFRIVLPLGTTGSK